MARWPAAIWQPVAQCSGHLNPIAVCLHHQAGWGNPASVYASRDVSAHFWIPQSGTPVQHVDTSVRSWHGGGTLNDTSIGVETEGCGNPPHADPLNEHQLYWFGALMAWANQVHGIPLVLSESATTPGFNYHRCQGGFNTACPCDVRLNARAEILRRAAGGEPEPEPEPEPEQEEGEIVLSELTQYQDQPEVDHLFQVAGGTLWHKYTLDRGANWHNETLMGPGDAEVVTGPLKSLSVSVVEETCYVMCEEEGGPVWQAREGPAIGIGNRWDRRKLP